MFLLDSRSAICANGEKNVALCQQLVRRRFDREPEGLRKRKKKPNLNRSTRWRKKKSVRRNVLIIIAVGMLHASRVCFSHATIDCTIITDHLSFPRPTDRVTLPRYNNNNIIQYRYNSGSTTVAAANVVVPT